MTIILTLSSSSSLFCALVLLLLAHPLNAQYVVDEDFITKGGTHVKLSLIRHYLKYATDEQLSHMVFQFDSETYELTSHHRVIKAPNDAPKTLIDEPDFSSIQTRSKPKPLFQCNTPDGFFFYNIQNELVAAWGDTIDMHRLNSIDHPDIYINHFQTPQLSDQEADQGSLGLKRPQCDEEYNLEFDVRFDEELCARYGHSFHITQKVLQVFMQGSARVIQEMTCVRISVLDIFGTCRGNIDHGHFNWPSLDCSSPSASSGCDSISGDIMNTVEKDFKVLDIGEPGYVPNEYRDMRLVFSGLQGAGSLAGITYRAQACSAEHGNSWISGINRVAMYHEVGHMLGANHDDVGIMRPTVRVGEDLLFSDRSRAEMVRFVTADPRSWCLRRELGTLQGIVRADDWGPSINIQEISHDGEPLTAMGMTLASLSDPTTEKRDLILQYHTRKTPDTPRLFLRFFPNVLTSGGSLILDPDPVHLFEIEPELKPNKKAGFRIAAGHIADKSSNDLVLLYVAQKTVSSGIRSHVPYYHVGFGMSTINGPTQWTPALTIEGLTMQPAWKKMSRRDVWLGHVRTTDETDLVYAQLEESETGGGVASYKIGFNISPTSGIPTEWSEQFRIPGEFSANTRSFSISVVDIDNNGNPDLVIYVQGIGIVPDKSPRAKYAFIRVGKDLDETGRVTNGWTRFKRVPDANEMGMGAIDIAPDMSGSSPPVVVALSRVAGTHTLSSMAGKNVLDREFMNTGRSESATDALTEGCNRCFDGTGVSSCIKEVEHCRAKVDELNIQESFPFSARKTQTSLRVSALDYDDSLFETDVSGTSKDSMFCLGFNELRKTNSGCDVVDATTVLGKGLEIALSDEITANLVSRGDIETSSMFEDPYGTSGNGYPVIAQITIEKNVESTLKGAIREAENRMRNRFPSFQWLFNQNKVCREENSWAKKWTIKYFKKGGFNDDIF